MKLVKLEYTPLKVGLWQTDVLKPFSDLDINISRKGSELLLFNCYALVLFTNCRMVDAMLPVMAKLANIETLELVSIQAFHL